MNNGSFEKIFLKNHFVIESWQIWVHFIIVICDKVYIVKESWIWIFLVRNGISGIPNFFWKIAVFNTNLKSQGRPKKGFCPQKSNSKTTIQYIFLPRNKVVPDLPKFHQKMFFWRFFVKDKCFIKFLIIAVWALRQGERQIKNGFQSDFLGPSDIP